jgi:DNA-binding response OmpR family regulator
MVISNTLVKIDGPDLQRKQQTFLLNDLYIDPVGYQFKLGQKEIELTMKEFNVLYLFVSNRGKVVRRAELLKAISPEGMVDKEGALNVMICRLRKKIEDNPHHPKRLVSIKGLGYRLKE